MICLSLADGAWATTTAGVPAPGAKCSATRAVATRTGSELGSTLIDFSVMCIPAIGIDSTTMTGTIDATTATRRRTTKSASPRQKVPFWAAVTARRMEKRSSRSPSSTIAAGVSVSAADDRDQRRADRARGQRGEDRRAP